MSPYGTISTIHRAEVRVPEDVYQRFGHLPDYNRVALIAAKAVERSGQNTYAEPIEWGEAPTRMQCVTFINVWHNWILQWQEQLRMES